MMNSFSRGLLGMEFFEVAAIVTFASDLRDAKTDKDMTSANALIDHFSQDKFLYGREQFFEFDTCELDAEIKERITAQAKRYSDATRLYEQLQINPTTQLAKEFQDTMNDPEFGELLRASIPNDIRIEFDQDNLRSIQAKVVTRIPFQKTREKILERVEDAFNSGTKFVTSVAVSGHMRFTAPATKALGTNFQNSLLGLH